MPQLIAMVIVVVGAMIYMFQTFGGTGDKIEGIAQKASILTEINNIKNGIQLAVRSGDVKASDGVATNAVKTLEGLAELQYFDSQINEQLDKDKAKAEDTANVYQAISFGADNSMEISLVVPDKTKTANARPGLFIDFTKGSLKPNAGFLEAQIAKDLEALSSINRISTDGSSVDLDGNGNVPAANRPASVKVPSGTAAGTATTNLNDGRFTIYFKDLEVNIQK